MESANALFNLTFDPDDKFSDLDISSSDDETLSQALDAIEHMQEEVSDALQVVENMKAKESMKTEVKDANYRFQIVKDEDVENFAVERIPNNTRKQMQWALRVFDAWRQERNRRIKDNKLTLQRFVPEKPFENFNMDELHYALPRFIAEARKKKDGMPYPGNTLFSITTLLQGHLRMKGVQVSFLKDIAWKDVQDSLDLTMKQTKMAGIGIAKKRADTVSCHVEEELWDKGILGEDAPDKLVFTLMYLIGLHFALRSSEHKALKIDVQLKVSYRAFKRYPTLTGSYSDHMSPHFFFSTLTLPSRISFIRVTLNTFQSESVYIRTHTDDIISI